MPVNVAIHEQNNTDALLARLPIELRGTILDKAIKETGRIVEQTAARLAPRGTADDGRAHLADVIRTVVRQYPGAIVGIVGATWPEGAHAHLVEFGHVLIAWGRPTGKRVAPKPFLRPAVDQTKSAQAAKFIQQLTTGIDRAITAAGGRP